MDLYLDKPLEKEASFATRLSDTADNWPQELTSELYKQLPYLSDYDLNVNLDRVDSQRGFAFGYADVANKTERPEAEHSEHGLPHIRIPLIIQERQAKPFSVFLDGERAMPLNEERVRETLFNPGTFDLSQTAPRDPSLIEPLMPPTRSSLGMGGEYKMASVVSAANDFIKLLPRDPKSDDFNRAVKAYHKATGKRPEEMSMAEVRHWVEKTLPKEKKASLLRAIAPTLNKKDVDAFLNKVASDPTLRAGLKRSGAAQDVVEVFDNLKLASAEDRLSFITDNIEPTVITIHKFPGGDFLVKSAAMQGQVVPQQEAGQMIGQENAQQMMPGQTATVVPQPVQPEVPVLERGKPVDEFGEYKVIDAMGNQIMGWVFPETLAWDGSFAPQPIALFTNGSAYAVQDSIVGEMVGKGSNLPIDRPLGDGCFYTIEHGGAIATAPITVKSMLAGPDGNPKIIAHDLFGNQIQIAQMQGLTAPQRITDIEFGLPADWKFMRLNNQTQLQGGGQGGEMGPEMPEEGAGGMSDAPAQPKKPAAKKPEGKKADGKKDEKKPEKTEKPTVQVNVGEKAKQEKTAATLWFNGGFNIDGGCGLRKLAADLRFDMSPVDAEFMLGLLGVDGHTAKQKVAEARRKGSVKLAGLRTITLASERYQESVKTASALLAKFPNLRRDLTKEAAALDDRSTVNNVLALNYINPENVSTFVDYLPELEQTSEKLSEMLLYSYLGMNELPEGAVARSLKGVEDVISGLKSMSEAAPTYED
jgi:hypothetical protein